MFWFKHSLGILRAEKIKRTYSFIKMYTFYIAFNLINLGYLLNYPCFIILKNVHQYVTLLGPEPLRRKALLFF